MELSFTDQVKEWIKGKRGGKVIPDGRPFSLVAVRLNFPLAALRQRGCVSVQEQGRLVHGGL